MSSLSPIAAPTNSQPTPLRQIVFIDGTVEAADQLALSTLPGVKAVLLDPTQDGIDQITAVLEHSNE